MSAVLDGVETVLRGPKAFGVEPYPLVALERVKNRVTASKPTEEMIRDAKPIGYRSSRVWLGISLITLGGHLLPKMLCRRHAQYAPIGWTISMSDLLRSASVIVGMGNELEVHHRKNIQFLCLLARTIQIYIRGVFTMAGVKNKYSDSSDEFRSPSYWYHELKISSIITKKEH
jgi:hypothetical protein